MRVIRRTFVALACLVVAAPAAPAQAAGFGCTTAPYGTGWLNPSGATTMTVTGAMGGVAPFPACTAGPGATTLAEPCGGALFEYTVRGAYCGIVLNAYESADCAWDAVGAVAASTTLVIGFDSNFDGHIGGETMVVPMGNGNHVKNPHGYDVRIIGFPMSTNASIYPVDHFVVRCWQ